MNYPEIFCTNCDWEGNTSQLDGIKCPECGDDKYIEDFYPFRLLARIKNDARSLITDDKIISKSVETSYQPRL